MSAAPKIHDEAARLIRSGYAIVPIHAREKRPTATHWPTLRITEAQVPEHFAPDANLGIILGEASGGLVDIDLDSPEAVDLAPKYLPPTDAVTGRGERPGSHYWYRCPEIGQTARVKYADGSVMLEMRSRGAQTVVGPSIHPSGDTYDPLHGEPAVVDAATLREAVAALVAACREKRGERPQGEQAAEPTPDTRGPEDAASAPSAPSDDTLRRAVAYLGKMPGAISGQGGHDATYAAAAALVHGFGIDPDTALGILDRHYNPRCDPPWTEGELRHKVEDADTKPHDRPRGYLRDAQPVADTPPAPIDPPETFEPFPLDTLPEPIRAYIAEHAEAIGCDPAFITLPMLSALGATIGTTRRLMVKRTWGVFPIVWTAVVGESGTMKSPAFVAALAPVRKIEDRKRAEHEAALADHARDLETYEAARAKWKAAQSKPGAADAEPPIAPAAPACERLITCDATTEALADMLRANPRGLLVTMDELAGWFRSFDRYAKGGGDAQRWLSLFDGGALTVDRKTSGSAYVRMAAVSITGGIQPGLFRDVMTAEHRESGMAARFLFAAPPPELVQWTDAESSEAIDAGAEAVFAKLDTLAHDLDRDTKPVPRRVAIGDDARPLIIDHYNRTKRQAFGMVGEDAAKFAKLLGYAHRFALIVHLTRWASGEDVDPDTLDAESARAGIDIAEWFGREYLRAASIINASEEQTERARLIEWVRARAEGVTASELARGLPGRFGRDTTAAEAALDELVSAGMGQWVDCPPASHGGAPTRRFRPLG